MTYLSTLLGYGSHRVWRLGEAPPATVALDSSGNGVNGTYLPNSGGAWTGGTLGVAGANSGNTAATFNGSSGTVNIGNLPADSTTAWSWTGWVNITTGGGYRMLHSRRQDDAYRFEIHLGVTGTLGNDLGLVVAISEGAYSVSGLTGAVFTGSTWHHVAVVFDGTATNTAKLKIYVDGAAVSVTYAGDFTAWSHTPTTTATTAYLGSRGAAALFFAGKFDDVATFNSALSAGNVSALYAARDVGGPVAPSISTHPASQTVTAGSTATFAVAATGDPTLLYQWQRNASNISGATAASYTTPATTVSGGSANNGDTYRCVVTNGAGSATSNSAPLTVSAAPSITTATTTGPQISLSFSGSVTLTASAVLVLVDGNPIGVTATGSANAWTLDLGARWIKAGSTVTITYAGATSAVTNNSAITAAQVKNVGGTIKLFLHWGISTFEDQEQGSGYAPVNAFAPSAPALTCVRQWVAAAKMIGADEIVITAKHHPGHCIWPSQVLNVVGATYTLAQSSWYAGAGSPDFIGLLAAECRAAGIGLGLYYSPYDRNFELGSPTAAQYIAFTKAQLTELLTNYGAISSIWFDGWGWAGGGGVPYSTIPHQTIYDHCAALQPNCVLITNNHEHSLARTQVMTYEVPIEGPIPSNNLLPAQNVDTLQLDGNWFSHTTSDAAGYQSVATMLATVSSMSTRRASILWNMPPGTSGLIAQNGMRRLAEFGAARAEVVRDRELSTTSRTITLTLRNRSGTLQTNLTGLKVAVYDQRAPGVLDPPVYQATNASTNGSGVLTLTFASGLPVGGTAWLEITNSDGLPATAHKSFAGPVTVS